MTREKMGQSIIIVSFTIVKKRHSDNVLVNPQGFAGEERRGWFGELKQTDFKLNH
jgi:hypothetical protein